jgi:hydroxylaminobenzene mutase
MTSITGMLCFTGLLLFLLGLLVGFGIPAFANPRIGVSAHATAVQSGTALLAIGLLWPHLQLSTEWSLPLACALWMSLYLLFAGLTLGAIWSTGRTLPVAGGPKPALPWQEQLVQWVLAVGGFGTTAAILGIIIQWVALARGMGAINPVCIPVNASLYPF